MNEASGSRGPLLLAALLLLIGLAASVLSGCARTTPGQPVPQPPDQGVQGEAGTSVPVPTEPPDEIASPPAAALTLTLWTTDAFSPTQAITTGRLVEQEVAAFESGEEGAQLEFVLKQPYGKGGILDYLLTTGAVVPGLLPDVVLIDMDELDDAVQAGLVQPLDELLPSDLAADLYPFVREACTFDGRLYCLPIQADLEHMAYDPTRIDTPPSTWSDVLSTPEKVLFPAGGQGGLANDAFLMQYLDALGAEPDTSSPPEPFLVEESLIAVLQFYRDGVSRGVFPPIIDSYRSAEECWSSFLAGQAAMTQVSAHQFLGSKGVQAGQARPVAPAAIPAISGPARPIGKGWALALVTPDPARQALAVRFMTRWLEPKTTAAWNRAADTLPTRRAGFALWAEADQADDEYDRFIEQQLLMALPRPRIPNEIRVAASLQQAIEAVLSGEKTPEAAAAQVMAENP